MIHPWERLEAEVGLFRARRKLRRVRVKYGAMTLGFMVLTALSLTMGYFRISKPPDARVTHADAIHASGFTRWWSNDSARCLCRTEQPDATCWAEMQQDGGVLARSEPPGATVRVLCLSR